MIYNNIDVSVFVELANPSIMTPDDYNENKPSSLQ